MYWWPNSLHFFDLPKRSRAEGGDDHQPRDLCGLCTGDDTLLHVRSIRRCPDRKKGAALSDEKKAYVRLTLHDLTIIDEFICFSQSGMEAEPIHRVLVNARGEYELRSDALQINGQRLELNSIQFTSVSTKEDCLRSYASSRPPHSDGYSPRFEHIAIYMIDGVFMAFVDLLRRDEERGEIVMMLDAQPNEKYPDILRLTFDGITITGPVRRSGKHQMLGATASYVPGHIKRMELLLSAIAVIMGFMLLHFVFR